MAYYSQFDFINQLTFLSLLEPSHIVLKSLIDSISSIWRYFNGLSDQSVHYLIINSISKWGFIPGIS